MCRLREGVNLTDIYTLTPAQIEAICKYAGKADRIELIPRKDGSFTMAVITREQPKITE